MTCYMKKKKKKKKKQHQTQVKIKDSNFFISKLELAWK